MVPAALKAKLIVSVVPAWFATMPPVKFTLLPLRLNADAPLLKVIPAKLVPGAKSLLTVVTLDVPKSSVSVTGVGVAGAPPVSQLAAFQKLVAGDAAQVRLAAWILRAMPTALEAAARITAARFELRIIHSSMDF